jgi:hypothetical protein
VTLIVVLSDWEAQPVHSPRLVSQQLQATRPLLHPEQEVELEPEAHVLHMYLDALHPD